MESITVLPEVINGIVKELFSHNGIPFMFVMALVLIVVVSVIFSVKRRNGIKALAEQYGYKAYAGVLTDTELYTATNLKFFHYLFTRRLSHIFTGVLPTGDDVIFFELFSAEDNMLDADTKQHARCAPNFTCALVKIKSGLFPAFKMVPETCFEKIKHKVVGGDIDFDSAPVFSSKYSLSGEEEARVRYIFLPEVLACFERYSDLRVQALNQYILIYTKNILSVDKYQEFIECVKNVMNAFATSFRQGN